MLASGLFLWLFCQLFVFQTIEEPSDTSKSDLKLVRELRELLQRKILMKTTRRPSERSRVPSYRHEELVQRIPRTIDDLLNFVRYELGVVEFDLGIRFPPGFIERLEEYRRPLDRDFNRLKQSDGFENWRCTELQRLSALVQSRLHKSQNPPQHCDSARKLISWHYNCGFTCEADHIINCLTLAYGTRRMFVLLDTRFYNYDADFEEIFEPLSEACSKNDEPQVVDYPGDPMDRVVHIWRSYTDPQLLPERPKFFPIAVPVDLALRIEKVHVDPGLWWTGQLVKYVMRYRPWVQIHLDRRMTEIGFERPIVGVHVRRTDKKEDGVEFHEVEEYMAHVDRYFEGLQATGEYSEERRVFLATDDPAVTSEMLAKYPHYKFVTDLEGSKEAELQSTRYSKSSLLGVLLVIHLLARTDRIVCTLSSEVCRTAYETKQFISDYDATHTVDTLDYVWLYIEQSAQYYEAVLPHTKRGPNEISFERGDRIQAMKERIETIGLVGVVHGNATAMAPKFKLKRITETVKFPNYGIE